MIIDEAFAWLILEIVAEIPYGQTATYGQIADLAGHPRNARAVGRILSHAEIFGNYPCHRVVNAAGRTAGTACVAGGRGRAVSEQRQCGPETMPVETMNRSRENGPAPVRYRSWPVWLQISGSSIVLRDAHFAASCGSSTRYSS